jgi:Leucine-rich repeat (LRR) protein
LTSLQRFKLEDDGLGGGDLGNAVLERIAGLTKLRVLDLKYDGVTDDGLRRLWNLVALEELNFSFNSKITDKGVINLKGLSHLRRLDLAFTKMGDASAGIIGHLTALEELSVACTGLTDAGMKDLQGLKHLKKLDLLGLDVTDNGLKYLGEMRGLKGCSHKMMLRIKRGAAILVDVSPELLPAPGGESQGAYRQHGKRSLVLPARTRLA